MVFGRVGKTKSSKVRPDDAVDASSTPNAESWKESGDNVTFSILVGVGLEVTCKFPYDDPQSTNLRRASARVAEDTRDRSAASPDVKTGSFAVTGPPEVVAQLEKMGVGDDLEMEHTSAAHEWCLSPTNPVTLAPAHRQSAGVPMRAVTFCYIHPIPSLQLALESLHLAQNEWAFVLLLGGFAYFGEDGKLLAVNAVSLATSTSGLALVGHPVTSVQSQVVVDEMTKQGRLVPPPADWIKGGFKAMAWVHPAEAVAGGLVTTNVGSQNYDHGAFLFECKHNTLLYSLVPVSGTVLQNLKKREAKAVQERKRALSMAETEGMGSEAGSLKMKNRPPLMQPSRLPTHRSSGKIVPLAGRLAWVMADMKERSVAAERSKAEASKLAEVVHREKVKEPISTRLKKVLMKLTLVALYIGLGVLCYMALESEWSPTVCAYFSVATISTVGYGDPVPSSARSRGFTAVYMIFGIPVVVGLLGDLYESSVGAIRKSVVGLIKRNIQRIVDGDSSNAEGNAEEDHSGSHSNSSSKSSELPSTFMHYLTALAPSLVVGLSMNILFSAYIFTLTSKAVNGTAIPYTDAVWHCWVTATTVGYGDITLDSEASLIWASFHILLAVSWLSSLLANIQKAVRARGWAVQREKTRILQMSPNLIAALDFTGNGQVNKMEFCMGMIIALGAEVCGEELEYETHVKPLMARFDRLDEDGDGYLEMDDLAFLVQSSRKENSYEADKLHQSEKQEKDMMINSLSNWARTARKSLQWSGRAKSHQGNWELAMDHATKVSTTTINVESSEEPPMNKSNALEENLPSIAASRVI